MENSSCVCVCVGSAWTVHQLNPAQPQLERLLRQLLCVVNELAKQNVGAAAFVNPRGELS